MRLETISTGDEIVRGRSVDTNAPWIAEVAAAEGILRHRHTAVGDDLEGLTEAFLDAARRSDFVVVTGGLGPTEDDYTRRAAARAAGVDLVLDIALLAEIEALFASRGRVMAESNRGQAYIPAGAAALRNPLGTAPGFRLRIGGAELHFLSGVPREMVAMFEAHVLPALRTARGPEGAGAYRALSTYGRPEAFLDERLRDLMKRKDLSVGLTASHGVIKVTIQTVGAGAAARADEAEAEVRRRLGDLVLEAPRIEDAVGRLLLARGLAFATAESCTGGLIGKLLTDVPGISGAYRGGVIAYSNDLKTRLLAVPEAVLTEHGAVSEPVARAMAEGARVSLGADLAVSVTGVAGPDGGTEERPVGLVWFGLAGPDGTTARWAVFPGDRDMVRGFAANMALGMVRTALKA